MRLGLAVVITALVLTGCSWSESSKTDRVSAAVADPTAEDSRFAIPVPDAPVAPLRPTLRDAREFGEYFLVEEVGYLVNAGFPSHYLRSTAIACEFCRDLSAEAGRWNARGPVTMERMRIRWVQGRSANSETIPSLFYLVFDTRVAPVLRDGKEVEAGWSGRQLLAVYVFRGDWQVARWYRVDGSGEVVPAALRGRVLA